MHNYFVIWSTPVFSKPVANSQMGRQAVQMWQQKNFPEAVWQYKRSNHRSRETPEISRGLWSNKWQFLNHISLNCDRIILVVHKSMFFAVHQLDQRKSLMTFLWPHPYVILGDIAPFPRPPPRHEVIFQQKFELTFQNYQKHKQWL
jgi:hypothetical protein